MSENPPKEKAEHGLGELSTEDYRRMIEASDNHKELRKIISDILKKQLIGRG